jgi:hypothetical protein
MGYAAAGLAIIVGGGALTGKGPAGKLKPSSPLNPSPPPVMPDQNSVLQAQQLQEAKDASVQYGRAATVLTGTGATGASTTGDRLGP